MRHKTFLRALGCLFGCALAFFPLCACGKDDQTLQDGYYTAQAADPSYGWREYVTIMVKEGKIVATEYNAINDSGFVKSWDNAYMQNMLPVSGTYPNDYTRYYASQLTGAEGEVEIDALSGATSSHDVFQELVYAVIDQARKGDSSVIQVPTAALVKEE